MSWNFRKTSALVWLGLGLLAGLLVAGFWPSVPLHAVATDKIDTFSMATGPVEGEYEAVYFLDHLTGDLHAYVIGRMANGGFGVLAALLSQRARRFQDRGRQDSQVSHGNRPLRPHPRRSWQGRMPSRSVLYIADVASGMAGAYAVPYNTTQHVSGRPTSRPPWP